MKTKQIITVCLLAAFLAGFGLWSVIRTPDAVSQAERRPLAQRPAFTAAGFLSGKFSDALDDFAADQFPLREQLRTLRSLVSYDVMRQRDVNGVYLSQGYAAKLDFPLNTASVERAADRFRYVYDTYLSGTDTKSESGKPVLVLGTSPDYPPYEFYSDSAMTQFAGIDVEVAKYIADSMGMELQIEAMNFDNLVTSLSNGDFDMVLAACEYTEERALACDFSDPYYTDLPPVILVKAANADKYKTVDDINQASVIIGAQKNTTKAMAAADMFPEAANGMVLESLVPTLVTELKNGTIDLLVLDGNVGLSYVG